MASKIDDLDFPSFSAENRQEYRKAVQAALGQLETRRQESRRRLRPVPCPGGLRTPEQGIRPDCAHRMFVGRLLPSAVLAGQRRDWAPETDGSEYER